MIRSIKLVPSMMILAVGILIGGILGWSLKPDLQRPLGQAGENVRERQRPSQPSMTSKSRFESEFKAIQDRSFKINRDDPGQDSAYLEALASALLKRAGGYAKLQGEEGEAFSNLLTAMVGKNFERTLDWIDQAADQESRASLVRNAIQAGMKDRPVRDRLDLFKGRDFTAEEIGSYAGNLMLGYEIMSTETALYLLGHVQPSDGGYSGGTARFDESFDFAGFATATLQLTKANKNRPPNVYPMNFFTEWTRSDPQAAASFYFTHCIGKDGLKLPYNTLKKFMNELQTNIPEAEYGNFVATALGQQLLVEMPDNQLIDELLATGLSSPDALAETLKQIPSPAVRKKLLSETVSRAAQASASYDGNLMQLRGALSLYNDPVARMGDVEEYARNLSEINGHRDSPRIVHNLCVQLAILGHSDSDLQRVRRAASK